MRKILLIIIGMTLLLSFSYAQTVIKLDKRYGVYYMTCKLNGVPLDFFYDTGASSVSISLTEALFMLKNGQLTKKDIIGGTRFNTADRSVHEGTIINLRSIQIGGLVLNNVEASVVHNMQAPLLLGQSALNQLGKILFDYSNYIN